MKRNITTGLFMEYLVMVSTSYTKLDGPAAVLTDSFTTTQSPMGGNTTYPNSSFVDNTYFVTELPPSAHGDQLAKLQYWINGVITNVVMVLGLIGNMLTIIILSRRAMRSSTNYYLSALAVWDSIVLVCTGLLIGIPGTRAEWYISQALAYIISYIYPLALIAQTATIWLTVSFTVERYIAVCHPLRATTMCTICRAKLVIISVSIGASLFNIPRWFDYRPEVNTTKNITSVQPVRTEFNQNSIYLHIYLSGLYVPIMCIIPLVLLSVLNTFLVLAVRKSKKQRADMNVRQSRENNVTIMLVSVVMVFIICQVPALVYNLAYAINSKYVSSTFGYQVLSEIRNFLVTLNSAVNFLLYCAFGQKFRRIFIHTFCRQCEPENYIPMSGVSQQTMIQVTPMRKGAARNTNERVLFAYRANTNGASPKLPAKSNNGPNNNGSPTSRGREGRNGMMYKHKEQRRHYMAMRPLRDNGTTQDIGESENELGHDVDADAAQTAQTPELISPMYARGKLTKVRV